MLLAGQMDAIPGMLLLLLTLWTRWTGLLPFAQPAAMSCKNDCPLWQVRQYRRVSPCCTDAWDGRRLAPPWHRLRTGGLLLVFFLAFCLVPSPHLASLLAR